MNTNITKLTEQEIFEIKTIVKSQKFSVPFVLNLFNDPKVIPKYKIIIQDQIFYITNIINTPAREQVILYSFHKSFFVPRVLYKSLSDGTWRVSPYALGEWYGKGKQIHYTQETKLHKSILSGLFEISNDTTVSNIDFLSKYFQLKDSNEALNKNLEYIYTYNDEVFEYDDKGFLDVFKKHTAGKNFTKDFSPEDYVKNIPWEDEKYISFFPDFNILHDKYILNHSLLGKIECFEYVSILQDKKIVWVFCKDSKNRIWIDRVAFYENNSSITSYGTESIIINTGMLTSKPLEYYSQCENMTEGIHFKNFNNMYYDISLYLSTFPIIKKFKLSLGL